VSHPERVDDYLEHIASAIKRAIRYTDSMESLAALEQDEQAQDAIVRTLTVIGEAAVRIQKAAPEFVAAHPELPWSPMRGIRNKVVHDYFDVAWDVVWDTVKQDLPPLLEQVKSLLSSTDSRSRHTGHPDHDL
jgi:uncharacterized protein with HEPN domain